MFVNSFFTRLNFFNLACFMLLFVQRWMPLMVARSWHRDGLEEILSTDQEGQSQILQSLPSPYLSLPLMSIVKIARYPHWIDFTAQVLHYRNICNILENICNSDRLQSRGQVRNRQTMKSYIVWSHVYTIKVS